MPCQCSHETQRAVILDDEPCLQCCNCGAVHHLSEKEAEQADDKDNRVLAGIAGLIVLTALAVAGVIISKGYAP